MNQADVRRLIWGTVALLVWQLALVVADRLPLTDPDETLHACIARTMLRTGVYGSATFRDRLYSDRPTPYFWLLAGSMHVLGEHDWACRLPSVFLAVLTTIGAVGIAHLWSGARLASAVGFVMATSVGPLLLAVGVTHDAALTASVTLASWGLLAASRAVSSRRQFVFGLLAGLAMGLGVWSKGLLGVVLPLFALAADAVIIGRLPPLLVWGVALLAAAAVAGPFLAAAEAANPGFVRFFLIERHFRGFTSETQRHGGRSPLIYLPTLLVLGAPWLWLAIVDGLKSRRLPVDFAGRAGLLWLTLQVAFFTAASSRNPTYLLPTLPALAILGARSFVGWMEQRDESTRRRAPAVIVAVTAMSLTLAGLLLGPWLAGESSTVEALAVIRQSRVEVTDAAPVLWFYHVPESVDWQAPTLAVKRVFSVDLPDKPTAPTLFVTRESRLKEVESLPFVRGATAIPTSGKYRVFLCQPTD